MKLEMELLPRVQETPLLGFDEYVNQVMRDWQVPGLAIAIVKDDAVVLAKGYGVQKLGGLAPVNEYTLFALSSCSKAFTVASLAMLVDEGKLNWDERLKKYLPSFQLYDPYVTRELTVRDLLTHRSGLPASDRLWYGSTCSRDEILHHIRYLRPAWSFRSQFCYQNIMYLAAGQIIPAVTGKSWDDFVQERIFTPLRMSSSNTSITALEGADNTVTPHAKIDDQIQAVPWLNVDNIGAAGAINSNIVDMTQWLRLLLGEGSYQNQQLFSSSVAKEMWKPQIVMPLVPPMPPLPKPDFSTYGLAWALFDYRGRKVVSHSGGIDGMACRVGLIPEEKLGLVILSNLGHRGLPSVLMYRILDAYLGAPEHDWSPEYLQLFKSFEEENKTNQKKVEEARIPGTKPSLALEKFPGTYQNQMYGNARITEENGKLVLRLSLIPNLVGHLEHWHYDTFQVTWQNPTVAFENKDFVMFVLNSQGKIDKMNMEPNFSDSGFKRLPEAAYTPASVKIQVEDLTKGL